MSGNSRRTREAEERARQQEQAAAAARTAAEEERKRATAAAEEKVKISPEAQQVLTESGKDYEAIRSGDVSKVKGIANFLAESSRANAAMKRLSPTGSANLAFDVANPELLAMNEQRLNRQQAQDTALGVTQLAKEAEGEAVARIGSFSGMDLSSKQSLVDFMFRNAGLAQGNAGQAENAATRAQDRYQFERQQRGFWSQLATGAIGGGFGLLNTALGRR